MSDTHYKQNSDDLLRRYFELLTAWNQKINLTAIEDEAGFWDKHVGDCLRVLPYLESACRLLDVGTGAGIPGMILKIERGDIDVTLLDSTRKKLAFCDEAIRRLKLTGIRTAWGRAEDTKLQNSLGKFDVVISRATWALPMFLKIAAPYIDAQGRCIAMKGARWQEELDKAKGAMGQTRLDLEAADSYVLGGGEARCLVIFKR